MANPEHLKILKNGVEAWNKWRSEHQQVIPQFRATDLTCANLRCANLRVADLSAAKLDGAHLERANLADAHLRDADLTDADLRSANLSGANLCDTRLVGANLSDAKLGHAKLSGARLTGAHLIDADFSNADLCFADLLDAKLGGTDLSGAELISANLDGADLSGADLSKARIGRTVFADNDLSEVNGLDTVMHHGPSTIGIDTLYRSGGNIPEAFLRGAGVPDIFIKYLPSLVSAEQVVQYYSCFISYSTKDEEFAKRLHSRLRDEHVRVWFAPEDMQGGQKLHEQIDEAIRVYDRLLVVLSDHSIISEWVKTEVRRACKQEVREKRRKLFPIALVDFETLKGWEFFDADLGKDLAAEVREYYIPGFQNWKNHDSFETAFKKLLKALKAE